MARDAVEAGGAVVVRGDNEVLLIHRPRYDDWSFPKGKRDPGEQVTACAVREVAEETGLNVALGRPLSSQRYPVARGTKRVDYWVAHVAPEHTEQAFVPNAEVDQLRWVGWREAEALLSYEYDRATLREAASGFSQTQTLLVLRHAKALPRSQWHGADAKRGLTEAGRAQIAQISSVLAAYGVHRVISSSALRCLDSVTRYAHDQGLNVRTTRRLREEYADAPGLTHLLATQFKRRRPVVLCTHRPVLDLLFAQLQVGEVALAPGAMLVLHHRRGLLLASEQIETHHH